MEPEIAQLCAASGLAGLQGLAGGQAPTAAVGTFQPAPAGAAGAETEPFWDRPSPDTAARPLSAPSHGGSQGAVTLWLPGEMLVLTQGTSTKQEGTEIRGISWRRALGITSHLRRTGEDTGFGSATDLLQDSGKWLHLRSLPL